MRLFMGDGADQRSLRIIPADAFDPRPRGGTRCATIRADNQTRAQGLTVFQCQGDARRGGVLRDDRFAVQPRDAGLSAHRFCQGAPQVAVLDHMAHWPFFDLCVIEMHEERGGAFARAPVRHFDLEHRLRVGFHALPDPERPQHPCRSQRQRIGSPVKRRIFPRGSEQPVDQRDPQPDLRQSQGKCRAIQPTTDDCDICIKIHSFRYGRAAGIVHARWRRYRPFSKALFEEATCKSG